MAYTIEDYKKQYETARAAGDAAGMKAANDGANAIRAAQGHAAEVAYQDIANVANRQSGSAAAPTPVAYSESSAAATQLGVAAAPAQTQTTTFTDPSGQRQTGYIQNGLTYTDPHFTQRVGVGSIVDTQGGAYVMTENGGVPYAEYMASLQNQKRAPATQPFGADTSGMASLINQLTGAAARQSGNRINYATDRGVAELQRALQDAQAGFQTQQNQVSLNEQQAMDNSALYAEARGDRGGIGQAQYNAVQNTAAQNRLSVQQAQTKLSTDTARQISDLRAQGEFERADALLELTQNQLSQLLALEQWAAEYNMSAAQFQAQLDQFNREYELELADLTGTMANGTPTYEAQYNTNTRLINMGNALLGAGILPTDEQLKAMGITAQQAQQVITANRLAAAQAQTGKGTPPVEDDKLGFLVEVSPKDTAYQVAVDMIENDNYEAAAEYLAQRYAPNAAKAAAAALGCLDEYNAYVRTQQAPADRGTSDLVTNRNGLNDDGTLGWVQVTNYGRLSASELARLVDAGKIKENYNASTGKYTYSPVR